MYKKKKISLVLPAYNEEGSIVQVINDFWSTGAIDEIVVVDNNSLDNTARLARGTKKVKVIKEKKQGYGYAIQKGLSVAKGDILITCDADCTYVASDIKKLLRFSSEYDCVWATRVKNPALSVGSNMTFERRLANKTLSRLIMILYSAKGLTDMGATFRLINRPSYEIIKDKLKIGGGYFQSELTVVSLLSGLRIKEAPVHYRVRIGESKISGGISGGFKTAKNMLKVILEYRIVSLLNKFKLVKVV